MLKLRNIKKDYVTSNETVHALKNVSIEFRDNEFVCILGPSGCGKTTLLNIIGGLDNYTSGDLIINRVSTKDYKDGDWDIYRNHRVGFVFQNYNLIPHQTVLANVELALTLSGVSKNERRKRAIKVLKEVGLEDQMYKKPSQMSGGQMQRVAIARALVNDPDILLADEPTGALDSKTSVQIMEILKEISKDRLIIMVTHNPDLADTYASRIINLLDGKVTDDSNPYEEKENQKDERLVKHNKTSMSFKTALGLSLNNLLTKKGRTILTAFAGSIGIIGIALILSLSNGVQEYITSVEEETLSSYPLQIMETTVSAEEMVTTMMSNEEKEDHTDDKIYSNDIMLDMMNTMTAQIKTNNLEYFKKYIENETNITDYTSAISYVYNLNLQLYRETDDGIIQVNPNTIFETLGFPTDSMMSLDVFAEMFDNEELNDSMYEVVEGRWPQNYNEVVVMVDENNEITDFALYAMGLKSTEELSEKYNQLMQGEEVEIESSSYTIDEIMNLEFKLVLNSDYYKKEKGIWLDKRNDEKYVADLVENAETLKVVGIVKPSEESLTGATSGGVLYSKELTEYVINKINESTIAKEQRASTDINLLTGMKFDTNQKFNINDLSPEQRAYLESLSTEEAMQLMESYQNQAGATYEEVLLEIGIVDLEKPAIINIYPKDFDSKDQIIQIINDYNDKQEKDGLEENIINYTDIIGIMMDGVSTIIDVIGYVLMAFVSISLVVSSIMIGIITYISVLERTKEIGILRAIGASKKDISRVFNAETFIVGLTAGLIGIAVTLILNIPINIIIKNLADISNISKLPVVGAIILVLISVFLTVIAGLIPAKVASKKDPVEALRTE